MAKGKDKSNEKAKKKEIDWAADANFDKNRSMIYIEHTYECPIFQTKADEFVRYLQEQIPERTFILIRNMNGKVVPRPGAFEINFSQTARTSQHNLWSGINRGPPRRDKFPPGFESLMTQVRFVLKKIYMDEEVSEEKRNEDDVDAEGGGQGHTGNGMGNETEAE